MAVDERRFHRRLELVTSRAGLARERLLDWIVAWTGQSSAWILGDGDPPTVDLRIAELALAGRAKN